MRILAALILVLSISACVQVQNDIAPAESQLVISSSFERDISLDANSTYAFTPLQKSENLPVVNDITDEIEMYLNAKGYKQVSANEQPTFHIGFILEHEDDLSDEELSETFGLNPGLPDLPNLDKGTLLMFVLDGDNQSFVWRGAAQGFIIKDTTEEERDYRLKTIVHSMLNQFDNK